MTFKEFKKNRKKMPSKKFSDLASIPEDEFEGDFVYAYPGTVFIQILSDNQFQLVLDRDYYEEQGEEGLKKLEKLLYDFCIDNQYI